MAKVAKLVTVTFLTRIIVEVDDNITDEGFYSDDLMEYRLRAKLLQKIDNNEFMEAIDNITDDVECPFGTFDDEK